LFGVIGDKDVRGEAFVEESALSRIHEGAAADFVADLPEQNTRHCIVSGIDRINIATLDPPPSRRRERADCVRRYGAQVRIDAGPPLMTL
jgi:hypothetical protein